MWESPPPFSNDRTLRVTPRGKRAVFKKKKKKSVHAHQHASDVSVPRRRLTCPFCHSWCPPHRFGRGRIWPNLICPSHLAAVGQTAVGQYHIWPKLTGRIWPSLFGRVWPILVDRIWPDRIWPILFLVGARRGGGPKGWSPKGGGPAGWGPEGWGPKGGGPKISRFFFSLPPENSFFSSLSSRFSRGILVVFEAPGCSNVHVWSSLVVV